MSKEGGKPSSLPCPCCQIFLEGNLFLPPNEKLDETAGATGGRRGDDDRAIIEPLKAWKQLRGRKCLLVDTHGHAHLERESSELYHDNDVDDKDTKLISLSCAVEQSDWESCLQYAGKSTNRVAALGIHPWYLADLTDNDDWLLQLERLLQQHSRIMVGEIGLCKQARFLRTYEHGKQAAMELQRSVFVQQLELAAKYERPVSIHCVNQQGVLLDTFKNLEDEEKGLPPAMALHSFTGTAHHVQQLLKWEADVLRKKRKKETKASPDQQSSKLVQVVASEAPPLLYFGFSHTVNYVMCSSQKSRRQGIQAIQAVPRDRLLAESDVHCTSDAAAGTAGAIAYMAEALEESIEKVADLTTRNGLAFLGRIVHER